VCHFYELVSLLLDEPVEFESVLLTQKPDIVLSLESEDWPTIRLILDAKYRIDTSGRYLEQMRSPGPPADAINVLHRYRDAILEKDPASDPAGPGKRTVIEGVVQWVAFHEPAAIREPGAVTQCAPVVGIEVRNLPPAGTNRGGVVPGGGGAVSGFLGLRKRPVYRTEFDIDRVQLLN
jgi:hypothetical protein